MSRPKFLADNDLNEHLIDGVWRREPAVEILRVRDAGRAEWDDARVLEFASQRGLIVVSHDVNTMPAEACRRQALGAAMAGLLMVRQEDPLGPAIDTLVLIWSASEAEEWCDVVAFLPL